VQGGGLLACGLRDPDIMTGQVQRLERWIDTLAAQGPGATVPPAGATPPPLANAVESR